MDWQTLKLKGTVFGKGHPDTLSSIDCPMTSLEEFIKKEDWLPIIAQ